MCDTKKNEATDQPSWEISRPQIWLQHLLFVLAACATGLAAFCFWSFEESGSKWFDHLRHVAIVTEDIWFVPHSLINLLVPMLTITGAMLLIIQLRMRFFPGTEGTGIPQTIALGRHYCFF